MYLCMYVIAIVATPFNLQLRNFGTTFLMVLSKKVFLKFLKKEICRVIALMRILTISQLNVEKFPQLFPLYILYFVWTSLEVGGRLIGKN